jgi:hypothetical protein
MMLIKKEEMNKFFTENKSPSDSVAIISALSATADSLDNISYHYTYNLSNMLTKQIRSEQKNEQKTDELTFVLVPVSVTTNSSNGAVLTTKPLQTISATCIRSANNQDNPLDLEIVYAGFSRTH